MIALAALSIYSRQVKFFRVLALIFVGLGLFVQVSAHAAAVPRADAYDMSDCAGMVQNAQNQAGPHDQAPDRSGPCKNMTLGCLVAMNCLPTLALGNTGQVASAPVVVGITYLPALAGRLDGLLMRPESPPPQASLTA